jgi:hypothetical protein
VPDETHDSSSGKFEMNEPEGSRTTAA